LLCLLLLHSPGSNKVVVHELLRNWRQALCGT
jgi:hypothetical protein